MSFDLDQDVAVGESDPEGADAEELQAAGVSRRGGDGSRRRHDARVGEAEHRLLADVDASGKRRRLGRARGRTTPVLAAPIARGWSGERREWFREVRRGQ